MQLPHFQSLPLNNTNEVHDFLFNQKKQKYHFKCKLFSNAAALANQPKLLCIFFWLVTTWAHHLDCIRRLTSIKCKASRVVYDWNRINRHILCICEWAGNISIQPAFFNDSKSSLCVPSAPLSAVCRCRLTKQIIKGGAHWGARPLRSHRWTRAALSHLGQRILMLTMCINLNLTELRIFVRPWSEQNVWLSLAAS